MPYPTGDINQDGIVNAIDLSLLVSRWNTNDPDADLNNDGTVNAIDLSLLVSNWGATGTPTGTALLVTNESTLSAGNQALQSRLVSLGYSVTTRLDSAPVDYTGMDVVVFGSITGGNINGKYANPPIGVVSVDSWTHFGLGTAIGFQNTVTTLQVTNTAHPLSGGLSNGNHVVYNTPGYLVWSTNHNTATAITIATNPGQPTQPIVFGYEAGSMMVNHYATTRHVGMGLHKDVRANMSAAGWTLFDAAVAWARASTYVAPPPPAAPTGLTATASSTQVSLTWNTVAGAASYNVKRSTTSGGPYTTIQSNVTTTSFTNTGLTNGTTYYYVVSAVNTQGESANSSQVSATPVVASSKLGVYMDTTTLQRMRTRATSGPYRVAGDVSPNSPGYWNDHIVPQSNTFYSNPLAYVHNPSFSGEWSISNGGFPNSSAKIVLDCAQIRALVGGNLTHRTAVRDWVVAQVNASNFQWSDLSKFPMGHTYKEESGQSQDSNGSYNSVMGDQGHGGATWLRIVAYAFSNLEAWSLDAGQPSMFTAAQKNQALSWLYHGARYFQAWADRNSAVIWGYNNDRFNLIFNNRLGGNLRTVWWNADGSAGRQVDVQPHYSYNNRYAQTHATAFVISQLCIDHSWAPPAGKITPIQLRARTVQRLKEMIITCLHPDGTYPDQDRDLPPEGSEVGLAYTANTLGAHAAMANVAMLAGDDSLWTWETTQGYNAATTGSPPNFPGDKGLRWYMRVVANYHTDAYNRYATNTGNSDDRQDGRKPRTNPTWYGVAFTYAFSQDWYWKDELVKQACLRTHAATPAYPSSPSYPGWTSPNAEVAGLFQFQQDVI
jgi:hypothetical protein